MWNEMLQDTASRKRLIIFIFISTIVLYFVFSPATNLLYYVGDDFRYAFGGWSKTCGSDDGFYFAKTIGRPIQAYMDCLNFKFAYTLEHMRIVRFISICLLGCSMGLLAEWLYLLGFSLWIALCGAGSFLLIKRLYDDTVLTGAGSLASSVLLVILAHLCITYARSDHNLLQKKNRLVFFSLSAILIFCSLLMYPAMSFFFGTLLLIKLLSSNLANWTKTRRETIQDVSLFCAVCIVYFICAYFNMRYHGQAPVPDAYRLDHPNFNLIEIFKRIIPLLNVFDGAWMFLPFSDRMSQGIALVIVLASGILIALIRFFCSQFYLQNKRVALIILGQFIVCVFFLLLFSSSLFLMMPSRDSMVSRLLFATMASFLPLVYWCLYQWSAVFPAPLKKNIFAILVSVAFLMLAYQANLYSMKFAMGAASRLNTVKTVISNYLAKGRKLRQIHLIVSAGEYPYNKFFIINAALAQLPNYQTDMLVWCSLPRGAPGEEKDHQKEAMSCIEKLPATKIAVTYSHIGDSIKVTDSMLQMSILPIQLE